MRTRRRRGLAGKGGVADRRHSVYGLHAAAAVLARRAVEVESAVVIEGALRGRLAELIATLQASGVPIERRSRRELDRLCNGGVHQGILLRVPPPSVGDLGALEDLVADRGSLLRLLILDQVEDPRNFGACLRTADAAGIDGVVVARARSASLGDAALKAAAGAAEAVPIFAVPNLARALRGLSDAGVRLVGCDEHGERSHFDCELRSPLAIVLGAEGRGLRRLTRESCDELVRIPMRGSVESLNVSVAAGVVLYELVRQQYR